jgi:hypothetical protein
MNAPLLNRFGKSYLKHWALSVTCNWWPAQIPENINTNL